MVSMRKRQETVYLCSVCISNDYVWFEACDIDQIEHFIPTETKAVFVNALFKMLLQEPAHKVHFFILQDWMKR